MSTEHSPGDQQDMNELRQRIVDLENANNKLQVDAGRYYSLLENMEEGVAFHELVYDKNGKAVDYIICDINPAYQLHTGLDRKKVIGKRATDVYGTDESPYLAEFSKVAETGIPHNFETYFPPMEKHFEISVIPTGTGRFATLFKNINDKKKTEKSLRDQKTKITSIFKAAPVGIGLVNDRIISEVNDLICEMTGYSRDELIGTSAQILYPSQEEFERVGKAKYEEISTKGTGTVETRWMKKNGDVIDILLSSTPLDASDLSIGVTFTALDITQRKRAEAHMRQNEAFLASIFKTAPIGIIVVENRTMTTMNNRFAKMLGYRREELVGQPTRMLFPDEETFTEAGEIIYGSLDESGFSTAETILMHKSGALLNIQINSCPFLDSDKKMSVTSAILDITQQKKAHDALVSEKQFSDAVIEALPGIFYMYNQEGKLLRWNKMHEVVSGFNTEELKNKEALSWFCKEDWTFTADRINDVFADGYSRIESNMVMKDGRVVPYDLSGVRFTREGETYMIGVGLEITESVNTRNELKRHKEHLAELVEERTEQLSRTNEKLQREIAERRKAEKELSDSRSLLFAAIEQMPAGVLIATPPDGRITVANAAALGIRGETSRPLTDIPVELHPRSWRVYKPDGVMATPQELPLTKAVLHGESITGESLVIMRSDNEKRWVSANAAPVLNRDGEIIAGVVVFSDVTNSKIAESKLKKYADMQNILLREVNHRVKNNLTAIIGLLYNEQERAELSTAIPYSTILKDLIRRIESLSTVHSMLSSSGWRPLSLHDLCYQIVSGVVGSLGSDGNVVVSVNESDARINSNQAHHLTMVLNELTTNTIKYATPVSGEIQIKLNINQDDDNLVIVYSDNGPGYPEPFLEEDYRDANIGVNLIIGIIRESLRGSLKFENSNGARIQFEFKNALAD